MDTLVDYRAVGSVTTITMDDGKVNVLSPRMLGELNEALDRALADQAVVLLSGRDGVFSAGFDLPLLRSGGPEADAMVEAGFDLAARVLSFPLPVVIACTGHAVAMGLFLLLAGDYRVGADGSGRLTANEVAIGLTMPHAAVEIMRQRLTPARFNTAVTVAEVFSPATGLAAGVLDRVVPPAELHDVAREIAESMAATLDPRAHAATKSRARRPALQALRAAMAADRTEVRSPN